MFFLRHGWLIAWGAMGFALGFMGWRGHWTDRWQLSGWGRIGCMVIGLALMVSSIGIIVLG